MANEITVTSRIQVINGNYNSQQLGVTGTQFTQTAAGAAGNIQAVGTVEESLATGDVSTLGWFWARNLDDTNYIQWGFSTGVYGGRAEAGEPIGPFRLEPGTTVYVKANTAACNLQYTIFQD